jgi:opacity protein-like surface antigen
MNNNIFLNKAMAFMATALFLLGAPQALFAGIGDKIISIGPRATYSDPKDATEGQWFAGAQARLHISPGVALEGSIDYRRNDYANQTSIKTYPLQASILAYLMPGASWSPYLLGGGGWYYTEVDGPNNYTNTTYRFGLHAGAGLEFMLTAYLSLDGSYRYVWLQDVTGNANTNSNFQDSGSMTTIALNFLF